MDIKNFKDKFNRILNEVEDTNYGSILTQFRLAILVQETFLKNPALKTEIILYVDNFVPEKGYCEALTEATGELYMNLIAAHKCKSIFIDFGESYIAELFHILNQFYSKNTLFNKCNQ